MAYAKKLIASAGALAMGFALVGCSNSADDGPNFPGPPPSTFVAEYSPTSTGFLPFPSDLPAFVGSTDGTLNFTGALAAAPALLTGPSLNTLDGFSTSAPITTSFNAAINGSTLSGSTVVMIEMYLSNSNKGPATTPADLPPGVTSPVRRVLTFGVDYTAEVSNTVDSFGKILKITPLKPLAPSSGAHQLRLHRAVDQRHPRCRAAPGAAERRLRHGQERAGELQRHQQCIARAAVPMVQGTPGHRAGGRREHGQRGAELELLHAVDGRQPAHPRPDRARTGHRRAGHRPDDQAGRCPARRQGERLRWNDRGALLPCQARQRQRQDLPDVVLGGRRPAAAAA